MFRSALAPLEERGQLGSILLQYPKWVFPSNENRALIEDAVERLAGWRVAVEFRNGSWLNEKNRDRTLAFLSERSIPFVMVDEPQGFKSSVPPEVVGDLAGPRDRPVPRPERRDVGGEEHHARPSGSATSTRATSCPSGCPGSARRRPRRRRST